MEDDFIRKCKAHLSGLSPVADLERTETLFAEALKSYTNYRNVCMMLSQWLVAVYEGHRMHSRALEAVEKMIEIFPGSPLGYAKKIEILNRIGCTHECLEVLEEGERMIQKRIRASGPEFHAYETKFDPMDFERDNFTGAERVFMNELTVPEQSINLVDFTRLPGEVVGKIFDFVDNKVILNAVLVCRSWYTSIMQSSDWLRRPTFREYVSSREIKYFCKSVTRFHVSFLKSLNIQGLTGDCVCILSELAASEISVEKLTISMESDLALLGCLDDPAAVNLFASLRSLVLTLDLASSAGSVDVIMASLIRLHTLTLTIKSLRPDVVESIPGGTMTTFTNLENLEVSAPDFQPGIQDAFWKHFFAANMFPVLAHLRIHFCTADVVAFEPVFARSLRSLYFLDNTEIDPYELMELLNSSGVTLETLELAGVEFEYDLAGLPMYCLSGLRTLRLQGVEIDCIDLLRLLEATNGSLISLSFSPAEAEPVSQAFVELLVTLCPHLRSLSLTDSPFFDNDCCQYLAETCHRSTLKDSLTELDMSSDDVSDDGIKRVCESLPSLKRLHLLWINVSEDMVRWLRNKDIDVKWNESMTVIPSECLLEK